MSWKANCSYNSKKTPDFQKKKLHMKNLSVFNILVIFQLILKVLKSNFKNWSKSFIYIAIRIQKSTKRPIFLMIFFLRKQFFEKNIVG